MDGRKIKRGKRKGWEVSRKETFKVITKQVKFHVIRSLCFGLEKVINDMKCCKVQKRNLKFETR